MSHADATKANQARVYDYVLGGKDNYAADREAARMSAAHLPGGLQTIRYLARQNRAFLGRAVHHLAADAGIRQFLDIGTGIPSANNTHEVAQRADPAARVVYVDKDPVVLAHARALLGGTPEGSTRYVDADLRDLDTILGQAAETLDFTQPVAVVLVLILHMIPDRDDPHGLVGRLVAAVPSGSYVVIAHAAGDQVPVDAAAEELNQRMAEPVYTRSRADVTRFFQGLELLDPGVVQPQQWRPADRSARDDIPILCGVGRKP